MDVLHEFDRLWKPLPSVTDDAIRPLPPPMPEIVNELAGPVQSEAEAGAILGAQLRGLKSPLRSPSTSPAHKFAYKTVLFDEDDYEATVIKPKHRRTSGYGSGGDVLPNGSGRGRESRYSFDNERDTDRRSYRRCTPGGRDVYNDDRGSADAGRCSRRSDVRPRRRNASDRGDDDGLTSPRRRSPAATPWSPLRRTPAVGRDGARLRSVVVKPDKSARRDSESTDDERDGGVRRDVDRSRWSTEATDRRRHAKRRGSRRSYSRSDSRRRRHSYRRPSVDDASGQDSSGDESHTSGRRHQRIRLRTFDGAGSFETFWAHFENCADYNNWREKDKLAHLKAALVGDAGQVLWDSDPVKG